MSGTGGKKSSTVLGLYIGVILGAIVMMVAGGLGYKTVADLSLIFGILAGPSIGWIIDQILKKRGASGAGKAEEEDPTKL